MYNHKKSMEMLLNILCTKITFDTNTIGLPVLTKPLLTREEKTRIINAGVVSSYKKK